MDNHSSSVPPPPEMTKDPRTIARKYQLDICRMAMEENTIVYLGTGCGKTHIAVLLMYELAHSIRKPSREVCVFLAPTVPLVRQQSMVIENSTDFMVRSYYGGHQILKDHHAWKREIEECEVLVMTPQLLLQCLRHCLIRMEIISLLILDECHHAQIHTRHPYAQIMKEFYKGSTTKCPRIFGMTASPTIGKGGSNKSNHTKCINSLENLLDAKVRTVDARDTLEVESIVASPDVKVYFYDQSGATASTLIMTYIKRLEEMKQQCMSRLSETILDSGVRLKAKKFLQKTHGSLKFCLENVGVWGAIKAAEILLSPNHLDTLETSIHESNCGSWFCNQYLNKAASVLSCKLLDVDSGADSATMDTLEEPFFSNKLLLLIRILSAYRQRESMKCIIFVKRIVIVRTLAYILGRLKIKEHWRSEFLVGFHSGLMNMSRKKMDTVVAKFMTGETNLLVATNVAEEGLDIPTCCLVIRFDLPETVSSYIQSRGRARMQKSKYALLVERGNERDEKLLNDFKCGENIMNREVTCRTSTETFDYLEEKTYKVYATGASISTGCSVSLLHHYCTKLHRDMYFNPSPTFSYMDDVEGIICKIILPPNAPVRQAESVPCKTKDEAKRLACLNACMELHERGALTDYLLPGLADANKMGSSAQTSVCVTSEDEYSSEELHEMLVPRVLGTPWINSDSGVIMHCYYINMVPIPGDRKYKPFALFVKSPLPKEAESIEIDLHLAHGRIVKTSFERPVLLEFKREEVVLLQFFQEMWLKVILDRSEFYADFVPLIMDDIDHRCSFTFYLLLPVEKHDSASSACVDWTTIRRCLSSPVFGHLTSISDVSQVLPEKETLVLLNGPVNKSDIIGSLVFSPHNEGFFFVGGILDEVNGSSICKNRPSLVNAEYYNQRFGITLSCPEQPFLKAKKVFTLRNLLYNRVQENTASRELEEHFVELPPEVCIVKVIGFSKEIGSTLSLLPSLMHRLEHLLVAIELKDRLLASFPEAAEVRADSILEAITTEKCLERFSLERLEVLGDAFLKYVVGRHSFLSYEGLDEGQLTGKRADIVNNSNLYEMAIKNNLQAYICNEPFEPSQFFALGRRCKIVCDASTYSAMHHKEVKEPKSNATEALNVKCTKSHCWLHRKTIADVVEALVGACLVDSGFRAAIGFLRWIGIETELVGSDIYRACQESDRNMPLNDVIDVTSLEAIIGYNFRHRGLLLQAFVHPSYNKHYGECYQKLEFLGDAVLEYLITSYLYSAYPDIKPGHITDLRSIIVNNNSFAQIAVLRSFHQYLMKDSPVLNVAVKKFEAFVHLPDSEKDMQEEPRCPKVLGDIVESCIGAILLDTGFDLMLVWKLVLAILHPVLSFPTLKLSPIRELRELCQGCNFEVVFPDAVKDKLGYSVKVEVAIPGNFMTFTASNQNSRAARKMAAQEALSKLKLLGHKHKHKSLEEIILETQKREAKLIGYDEDPIMVDNTDSIHLDTDSIHLEKLSLQKPNEDSFGLHLQLEGDVSSSSRCASNSQPYPMRSIPEPLMHEVSEKHSFGLEGQNTCSGDGEDNNNKTQKREAKLIVYDEDPIMVDYTDSIHLEMLSLQKPNDDSFDLHLQLENDASSSSRSASNSRPYPMRSIREALLHEVAEKHSFGRENQNTCSRDVEDNNNIKRLPRSKTARTQLYEICAANYWKTPFFSCSTEEGPDHLRMFTFSVVVEVESISPVVVECLSDAKPQKRAAQEHAAEGALWYLKHLGHLSNE